MHWLKSTRVLYSLSQFATHMYNALSKQAGVIALGESIVVIIDLITCYVQNNILQHVRTNSVTCDNNIMLAAHYCTIHMPMLTHMPMYYCMIDNWLKVSI